MVQTSKKSDRFYCKIYRFEPDVFCILEANFNMLLVPDLKLEISKYVHAIW